MMCVVCIVPEKDKERSNKIFVKWFFFVVESCIDMSLEIYMMMRLQRTRFGQYFIIFRLACTATWARNGGVHHDTLMASRFEWTELYFLPSEIHRCVRV